VAAEEEAEVVEAEEVVVEEVVELEEVVEWAKERRELSERPATHGTTIVPAAIRSAITMAHFCERRDVCDFIFQPSLEAYREGSK
jgi:hypothetical protein